MAAASTRAKNSNTKKTVISTICIVRAGNASAAGAPTDLNGRNASNYTANNRAAAVGRATIRVRAGLVVRRVRGDTGRAGSA